MFPLFETICVEESKILNGEWHEKRYRESYRYLYGRPPKDDLFCGIHLTSDCSHGKYKMRIDYNDKEKTVRYEPYRHKIINTLRIVEADDIDYSIKKSDRGSLELLFVQKGDADDVLIVKKGFVTDTSFCNIVFFDGIKWITSSTPLLNGTARQRLISQGVLFTQLIGIEDIYRKFTCFRLINAMRHFDQQQDIPIEAILR